jgi:hypothetical protein
VCVRVCVCVTEKQGSHERESRECERGREGEEEGGGGRRRKREKERWKRREGRRVGRREGRTDGVLTWGVEQSGWSGC